MVGFEPRDSLDASSFWFDHVHLEDRQVIPASDRGFLGISCIRVPLFM
jgi:hypothetical protein